MIKLKLFWTSLCLDYNQWLYKRTKSISAKAFSRQKALKGTLVSLSNKVRAA